MQFAADTELSAFLGSLGLTRYVPLFDADELDMETLALLQPQDYEQMGVPRGPRLKILAALRSGSALATDSYVAPVPSGSASMPASPSSRPLYDRIAGSRTPLGSASPAGAQTSGAGPASVRVPQPEVSGHHQHQHHQYQQQQSQQQHEASPTASAAAGPPALWSPSKGGAASAHTEVSRMLKLSPQSATTSFAALQQRADPATTVGTGLQATSQLQEHQALSPVEQEAQEFLSEMDSLLAHARERLHKRSGRQLPPAAGVSNLSTIRNISSVRDLRRPQPQPQPQSQSPEAQRQPHSDDWSANSVRSTATGGGHSGDNGSHETSVTNGSAASAHSPEQLVRAPAPLPLSSSRIPAIFDTELTSSDEEDEEDDEGAATGRAPSRTTDSHRSSGSDDISTSAISRDQQAQVEDGAPAKEDALVTPPAAAAAAADGTDHSEASPDTAPAPAPAESDAEMSTTRPLDDAEVVSLEIKALAATRSPEQAIADRSASQSSRTVHVSNLPEALAFFDVKLKALFEQFGKVISVTSHHTNVHPQRDSRSKNWGLVSFADAFSAREALRRGVKVRDHDEGGALCQLTLRALGDQDADALHIHHQQHLAKTDAQDDLGWLTSRDAT
jgi:hypothetical protein